jgi:hypothetical protein
MEKFPLTTKRLVLGHVSVCQGCCCGNTANGRPPVPVEWLKKEWRARGLLKRIQLSISGCLGACDIPNVVTISNEGGTQWLGGITEFSQYRALLEWAVASRDAGELLALPDQFREHCLHPPFKTVDAITVHREGVRSRSLNVTRMRSPIGIWRNSGRTFSMEMRLSVLSAH